MLRSRAALYFEEVAKRGSIRKASEVLNIAASAVDRQILGLERHFGAPLFDRTPQGLHLTAAGEILIEVVRRWRRDVDRLRLQMDDLQGLRQGCVDVAVVEAATDFLGQALKEFLTLYPGVSFNVHVASSLAVADMVTSGAVEIGLTFNAQKAHGLRVERVLIYSLGLIVRSDHPLATFSEIRPADCAGLSLIVPLDTMSSRDILDRVWQKSLGEPLKPTVTANSFSMMKSLVMRGLGAGLMTELDALGEIRAGELKFIPLAEESVPVWVLSIVSSPSRSLSKAASLFIRHLGKAAGEVRMVEGR